MILTVTLNPLLEHRLTYKVLHIGHENRSAKEKYKAGGKGINVSRQLNILSVDNLAFTFLGGSNGKLLKKLLIEVKSLRNFQLHQYYYEELLAMRLYNH